MTTVWFIRHGPTHAKGMVGWSDLAADLSDLPALRRLDAFLPRDATLISSDLTRAVATADAIARDRPRLPHDPRLREIHFGAWELLRHDQITDRDLARAFWDQPGDIAPPGGESWNTMTARVDAAVDELIATTTRDVIVVAHFGAILSQVQRALGLSASEVFAHRIEPLSVTRIAFGGADPAPLINHLA